MNKKEIEELIRFVSKAGVSEVSLETKDLKITIKNTPAPSKAQEQYYAPPVHAPMPAPAPSAAPAPAAAAPPAAPAASGDSSRYITVKSPMIGTFYRASGPDK